MYAAPEAGAYLAQNLDKMGALAGQGAALAPTGQTDGAEGLHGRRRAPSASRTAPSSSRSPPTPGLRQGRLRRRPRRRRGGHVAGGHRRGPRRRLLDRAGSPALVEQLASYSGGETSAERVPVRCSPSRAASTCPATPRPLAGDSMAVAVGSDFDPETLANSSDGSDVPVAAKVKGDARGHRVGAGQGARPDGSGGPRRSTATARVTWSPSARTPTTAGQVLEDGGLGRVRGVPQRGAATPPRPARVLFVNFDAGDNWLARLASGDQQVADNLEPLEGLGISAWQRRRHRARGAAPHHQLTGHCTPRAPTLHWGHPADRARTPRRDRSGDPDQVGRRDLQVEAAAAGGHEDGRVLQCAWRPRRWGARAAARRGRCRRRRSPVARSAAARSAIAARLPPSARASAFRSSRPATGTTATVSRPSTWPSGS